MSPPRYRNSDGDEVELPLAMHRWVLVPGGLARFDPELAWALDYEDSPEPEDADPRLDFSTRALLVPLERWNERAQLEPNLAPCHPTVSRPIVVAAGAGELGADLCDAEAARRQALACRHRRSGGDAVDRARDRCPGDHLRACRGRLAVDCVTASARLARSFCGRATRCSKPRRPRCEPGAGVAGAAHSDDTSLYQPTHATFVTAAARAAVTAMDGEPSSAGARCKACATRLGARRCIDRLNRPTLREQPSTRTIRTSAASP
jgi:hypothetical protein